MKINLAPHHHPDRDMFYFVLSRMRTMITEEEKKKSNHPLDSEFLFDQKGTLTI